MHTNEWCYGLFLYGLIWFWNFEERPVAYSRYVGFVQSFFCNHVLNNGSVTPFCFTWVSILHAHGSRTVLYCPSLFDQFDSHNVSPAGLPVKLWVKLLSFSARQRKRECLQALWKKVSYIMISLLLVCSMWVLACDRTCSFSFPLSLIWASIQAKQFCSNRWAQRKLGRDKGDEES